MSHSLLMKVISSSITSATRAGLIIRDVMKKGELGIVDKVRKLISISLISRLKPLTHFRESMIYKPKQIVQLRDVL